jgi:AAA15 family ATPase/GTPase
MKIKSIQFYDYRAFYAVEEADKPNYLIEVDSKNLLVYGENGSGKTSFFKGLKDIIYKEDFTSHFKTPILNEGYLEVIFDDATSDRFDAAGANASKSELLNISKLNSFLSYKELLRTHLDYDSEDEINFFKIIVSDILKEHSLTTLGQLHEAWDDLVNKDIEAEKKIIQGSVPSEISDEEASEQIEKLKSRFDEQILIFNDELEELLESRNWGKY